MVTPVTSNPPTQGQKPWFETREAFDLELKAAINALISEAPAATQQLLALPVGSDIPEGTPSGTLIVWVPEEAVPLTTLVETTGIISSTVPFVADLPTDVAVGDTVMVTITSTGSNDNVIWPAGWVEIDYTANQGTKVATGMYSVVDSTALANLGEQVTINAASQNSGTALCLAWVAKNEKPAPSYASGTNRSAATIASQTTSGGSIAQIATVTAAPIGSVYGIVANKSTTTNPDNPIVFTEASELIAHSHIVVDTISLNLTIRRFTTTPTAAPITAKPFTTTHPNSDAIYGGGVFVTAES